MGREYRVQVDAQTCKGCGICIHVCESRGGQNLRAGSDRTLLGGALPESTGRCNGCRWCERYCPDFAISVEEENHD